MAAFEGGQMRSWVMLMFSMLFFSGCVNYSLLDSCPDYFRENIGPIRYEPLNPIGLLFKGMVFPKDPNGTIYLYIFADNNTLLEEAFHSFEIRAGNSRNDEWEKFYYDFHSDGSTYKSYGGPVLTLSLMMMPFPYSVPGGKGYVNLYSRVSHFEDTASCFVALMNEREFSNDEILTDKIDVVRKFVNGKYSQKTEKPVFSAKKTRQKP